MSIMSHWYDALLELYQREEEVKQLKEEMNELREELNNYRLIAESTSNNKKIRDIKNHLSWFNREELKRKAKEVMDEEWLENSSDRARRDERIRRRREREEKLREMKERARKKKEAN